MNRFDLKDWKAFAVPLALLMSSLAVFLTYLIPEWTSFFRSDVFVFTNGWDEESYLSWQGILGSKSLPGYFPLHLNWALERAGLSGAMQNLILDTVLPPATAFLVFLTLRISKIEPFKAAGYATLICFGSVLFNANNPLIAAMLGETRDNSILIMSGWEVYASIVRTPDPEIPFFLIACAVFASVRLQRRWILLLPIPVLYYYTLVSYAFLLTLAFLYDQLRSRTQASPVASAAVAAIFTFVAMGIGLIGVSYVMGMYQPDNFFRGISFVFTETRRPQLPVGLLALAVLFAAGTLSGIMRVDRRLVVPVALLAITALGAVNFHIFTGFMLAQKNYYDYGLSALFSILTVIAIHSIRFDLLKSLVVVAVLLVITDYSYRSQMIWYRKAMQLSQELAPDIDKLRRDPLYAIFPKLETSHHVAYSTPRLLSPISSLYLMRDVNIQCGALSKLMADATTFLNDRFAAESKAVMELRQTMALIQNVSRTQKKSNPDYSYCPDVDFGSNRFYLAGPQHP